VTEETMQRHSWIGDDQNGLMLRGFARAGYRVARDFAIRTDHSALAWQAVCAGLGLAWRPGRWPSAGRN
jgi:DNA-binding transcriptional LysR family regulator